MGGLNSMYAGRKFGFENNTTDLNVILDDPEVDAVFITTRHESHAELVCRALKAKKHVFVEKPLAINREQLAEITSVYQDTLLSKPDIKLMVGFNRRFAPQVQKVKTLLKAVSEPKSIIITVNAGAIPSKHWIQDPEVGGGRIIGEGCHFIDLLRYLVGFPITEIQAFSIKTKNDQACPDTLSFTLCFSDGSLGTVHYFANGHKSFPKERLDIFCAGRILHLDNYKTLLGYGWPGFKRLKLWHQDKGHSTEIKTFLQAIQAGETSPIPFHELFEVTETSFKVVDLVSNNS